VAGDAALIVRTSWLFGWTSTNFVRTMLRLGAERDEVAVVDDQCGCPTYVGHLAPAVRELLDRPPGVWHLAADGECTWAGFAEAIFEEAGLDRRARRITTAELGRPAPGRRTPFSAANTRMHLAYRTGGRGFETASHGSPPRPKPLPCRSARRGDRLVPLRPDGARAPPRVAEATRTAKSGLIMCGLFGLVGAPPGTLDGALVGKLFSLLQHRGPDDRGWLALDRHGVRTGSEPDDLAGDIVLLHTRLSILDLSPAGHQPMSTPDGRYHLSFNGEIYNYVELRRELEASGHRFLSETDTEVLLRAWMEWGAAALPRLVGMFAFALVDTKRRTLVLARDHFGIKPLYYVPLNGQLALASEIPPLLELPGVSRRVNPQRAYDYLQFSRTDHGRETMFAAIRQVRPAHYVEVPLDAPSSTVERRYWSLEPQPVGELSLEEAAERLREFFLDNVRLHLRSDVPVGAAFSGGVDSSANVSAMRFLSGPDLDLHTFSYVADDRAVNEERWMQLVARETGVVAHTVEVSPQDLLDDLDRLIDVQAEPFGSTSIYAQYRVFRLAREAGIKVMLDGQGADELFAGYRTYLADRMAGLLVHGRWITAARLTAALWSLPEASPSSTLSRAIVGVLPPTLQTSALRLARRRLVPSWLDGASLSHHEVVLTDPGKTARGNLRQYRLDTVHAGLPELLRYEDRNSMASSIESRVPFLTPRLAEFAAGMPDDYLIAPDGTGKLVLRRSLRGLVPDPILERRDKIGFATPEPKWLRAIDSWVETVFRSDAAHAAAPLCVSEARRNWRAMRDGRQPFDASLWRSLNYVRWIERLGIETG
jgi:asparagine synthase (glutamine-hydrolysing)